MLVTPSAHIKQLTVDTSGRFAFVVCEISRFGGQRLPAERHFVKQVCSLVDLSCQPHCVIDKYSYIVRTGSRFQIAATFVNDPHDRRQPVYLLTRITSCLHDFDPESEHTPDWSDFETNVRVYGPIDSSCLTARSNVLVINDEAIPQHLPLHDEFKMFGEPLSPQICLRLERCLSCKRILHAIYLFKRI